MRNFHILTLKTIANTLKLDAKYFSLIPKLIYFGAAILQPFYFLYMHTAAIIIIDDDKDDCELIMQAFTELEVRNEIVIFSNSIKAFEYMINLTEKPFFILCDVNMPVVNGLELRKKINENERARVMAMPFLFWSTSGSEGLVNRAYSLNIQGFFKKPNSMQEIKETIIAIMNYWNRSDHPST
jgi:DNA-binding NarL/FixJ family response regulator